MKQHEKTKEEARKETGSLSQTKLILASNSPRRRELLAQIGLEFEVFSKDVEEETVLSQPQELVIELSRRKASAAADDIFHRTTEANKSATILGADTIVCRHGRILGKPKNEADAFDMLKSLSGATHQVYTGVTLIHGTFSRKTSDHKQAACARTEIHSFFSCTNVTVFPLSDREIRAYIATKEPMDKAGAYGIQGAFAAYIKEICGDYNNVVGLPVSMVYQELKKRNWLP